MADKIFCAYCAKNLYGGFKQEDNSYLCADCVIEKVDHESTVYCIHRAQQVLEPALGNPRRRVTKREAREIMSWLRTIEWQITRLRTERIERKKGSRI